MVQILEACFQNIQLGFEADCTVAESIGDPVVFSDLTDDLVEKLSDNVYGSKKVVGIILSKSSDTRCFVMTAGIFDPIPGAPVLDRSESVWVSTSGGLTTTKPATGHLQVLGQAISTTGMSVSIEPRKIIQA
jgi:hypothetical protein